MEDFMNELQENANLFEVNIPEYKQLKEKFEKYDFFKIKSSKFLEKIFLIDSRLPAEM